MPVFLHGQRDLMTLFFLVDEVLGLYKYLDLDIENLTRNDVNTVPL